MEAREVWECSNCHSLFRIDENCTCDRPNYYGPASQQTLFAHGFTIMSKEDVEAVRDKALEEAAQNAECHSDDRARRYSMDWNDGYIDGCKGAAAAIRSLKSIPHRG